MRKKYICFLFIFVLLLTSCSEYQKVLRTNGKVSTSVKLKMAEKLYKEENYKKAIPLFEQVYSKYLGKPQGERVVYMYAISEFKMKNLGSYSISEELFRVFMEYYPDSQKFDEVLFKQGKCNYKLSLKSSLDQERTFSAMNILQNYINLSPDGKYFQETNQMIRNLTNRIEKKSFDIAKHYGKIGYYKSSVKALELFLINHPGSIYREDTYFKMLEFSHLLAINSVYSKIEERLRASLKNYKTLMKYFPETKHKKKALEIKESLDKHLEDFLKNKTT